MRGKWWASCCVTVATEHIEKKKRQNVRKPPVSSAWRCHQNQPSATSHTLRSRQLRIAHPHSCTHSCDPWNPKYHELTKKDKSIPKDVDKTTSKTFLYSACKAVIPQHGAGHLQHAAVSCVHLQALHAAGRPHLPANPSKAQQFPELGKYGAFTNNVFGV